MAATIIRYNWLRGMYLYTAAGAGALGAAMLVAPHRIAAILHMPDQDPAIFGLVASAYVAFGLLALLGLRTPVRIAPVLLLQMVYKLVWIATVFVPLAERGQADGYMFLFGGVFMTYVIGDLIAIPFRQLLSSESAAAVSI